MIRNRIKKGIEKRRQKRANKNGQNEDSDESFDKIDQSMIDDDESNNNEIPKQSQTTSNSSIQSNSLNNTDQDIDENFDYLTDICKDKKFNKKELSIILRVIKLELQPIIYLLLFIKGVLIWNNTAVTIIIFIILLYFAYINIVKYLFGLSFLIIALLMLGMKTNRDNTIFTLALLVGLVTNIDADDDDNDDNKYYDEKENKIQEKDLKRWQLFKKARRIKQKIQKKFIQLGGFQYLLYQISIYIGKLRAVYFYKNEKFGKLLCILYTVIGLFCIALPLRFNYVIITLILFLAKPGLSFLRKKGQKGKFVKNIKAEIDKIEPDLPPIKLKKESE